MLKLLNRLLRLAILCGIVAAVVYFSSAAFAARWKTFVVSQLAERGVILDFRRLTLDPFRGLVARDVQVFNDPQRDQLIATLDRINLDFDVGRLLHGEVKVETLTLAHASVALPVDPEQPDLAVVSISDLNARIYIVDDRLDVRQAEGVLEGVRLSVTGTLVLPEKSNDPAKMEKAKENAAKRLAFIRKHRHHVQTGLQWMQRFSFAQMPMISLEVNGAADKPEELNARLTLRANGLSYNEYTCREIEALGRYEGGFFDLTRVHLTDALGSLEASGGWDMNGNEVTFRLSSSADLPALAATFLNSDLLREVVFYEPPNFAMDGKWFIRGPKSKLARPLSILGKLQCGRFATRGEIFDGLGVNFGADTAGFYVRDGLIRHKSGTAGFQALSREGDGLRYRATMKMDPRAFLPFITAEKSRELIQRFAFKESSGIFFQIEGAGPGPTLKGTKSLARAELREFAYRGVEFDSAEGELVLDGPVQIYKNITGTRPEGRGEAREVYVDLQEQIVKLTGVKGRLDHAAVVSCFAPKIVPQITRYRLPFTTEAMVEGVIGMKDPRKTDLTVSFNSPGGTGHYPLWGKDYEITNPVGGLVFKQTVLAYDVSGGLFGRPMTAKGTVNLAPSRVPEYTVALSTGAMPCEVFGEVLPFEALTADVRAGKSGSVDFNVGATLLGGGFGMKGVFDARKTPGAYEGEIKIHAVSFKRFAQVYSPKFESEGDLTGHFQFTGVLDDWKALRGAGAAIIVNGNLYAIPVIGPLTPLLSKLIPSPIKGYNVTKEANCTFKIADGFIVTDDVEALTSTFRIVSKGNIDFIRDDINFEAQVRVRGLPGIVLRPISELLEYKGTGTVGNPRWQSNPFGIASGRKDGQRQVPDVNAGPMDGAGSVGGNGKPEKNGILPNSIKKLLPFGLGGPKQ